MTVQTWFRINYVVISAAMGRGLFVHVLLGAKGRSDRPQGPRWMFEVVSEYGFVYGFKQFGHVHRGTARGAPGGTEK